MRIAIVKLSALGDIVHAMIVLQFIKSAYPQSRIDWIVEERFAEILRHNPDIDNILTVNLKGMKKDFSLLSSQIKTARKYAKNDYDIVIDMQGLIKSALLSKLIGPNAGFDKNSIREKAAALFYQKSCRIPYEKNIILRNVQLADEVLGMHTDTEEIKNKKAFLYFSDGERENIERFLSGGKKNIVYILGSSWPSKIYPKEKMLEVLESLGENALLVSGSEEEREAAKYISQKSDAQMLPPLSIGELKALISEAQLVIGPDSGPTHFAWALNRPGITIYGPTPARRNTLEGPYTATISSKSEVNPHKIDRNDMSIADIESSKIVDMAKAMLYGEDTKTRGEIV